jgi:hypothetical protein
MDDATRVLSAEALIRVGGWHPKYARVLLIEHDSDYAIALIDGNGDGAELELEYWYHDRDGFWRGGSTSGYGPLYGLPSEASWNSGEFVTVVGRAEPGAEVMLEYGGQVYRREASDTGVWGFIHASDSARPDELPAVTSVVPPSG